MENEIEKLRTELEEFVSNCNNESLLEEMLRIAKDYYSK